jgi:hypothetical protein
MYGHPTRITCRRLSAYAFGKVVGVIQLERFVADQCRALLHGVDWALGYPLVPQPFIDIGHKLETAIYLHWRRQRDDLGYLGGEGEIDLVVNPEQPELLVNIAAHINRPEATN